jgi:hypothetical protein
MSNLTLAIDDKLLQAAREYAQTHGTTVNGLVRKLLEQTVQYEAGNGIADFLEYARQHPGHSDGRRWTKDEIHERPWSRRLGEQRPEEA